MAARSDSAVLNRDILMCCLCLDFYTNAKTLPCLHSYCEECLEKLVEKRGELVCPQCRCPVSCNGSPEESVGKLSSNSLIDGLVQFVKTCDGCVERDSCEGCTTNPTMNRCLDCALNLCTACTGCHSAIKATKGHRVVSMSQFKQTGPEQMRENRPRTCCSVNGHECNLLKYHCTSCDVPICLECTIIGHRVPEHNHCYLEDVAPGIVGKLKEPLKKLQEKEEECKKSAESITCELVAMEKLYQAEVDSVTRHVSEIIAKVKKNGDELLEDLKKAKDQVSKHLECELDRYEITEKNIVSTRSFIDVLTKYGDYGEIVSEYKKAMSNVDKLIGSDTEHSPTDSFVKFLPSSEILETAIGRIDDGNPPGKGTVTKAQDNTHDLIEVKWDSINIVCSYCMGYDGVFRLKLAECY
ncbi:transcription intermediary factor 1-beta-like [Saccoglossus kowalevskii]|uniref:E3 ubiquitin-protein ligase TRIM56-like n=1 Tax=Saccoglossus kowalevskii TaxID=10224 RepID=A0ABM0M3U6_SACKO|nr:PREDICTED: E3 ubiquitin-protein ligase TRIM56-like [Saccoglossus kowalevskii]